MPSVTIFLFDSGAGTNRATIKLKGEQADHGEDVTLTEVVVARDGLDELAYRVVDPVGGQATIGSGFLDESLGTDDYRLRRGTVAATVTASLILPDPGVGVSPLTEWPFFGRTFAVTGPRSGIDLGLVLNLPAEPPMGGPPPATEPPLAVLAVQGHMAVESGSTTYSAAAVGYRVELDGLQTFPAAGPPALTFLMPKGFPWPDQRLPWPDFPTLPGPAANRPLRLPAFALDLDPVPIRLGWDKVALTLDGASGNLRATITRLRLTGPKGTVSGSPALEFGDDGVSFPTGTLLDGLTVPVFHDLGPGRFGFDAVGSALGGLLGLVSAELGDLSGQSETLKLRVRTTGSELQELRLDWGIDSDGRELGLPGFSATFPAVRMLSLVLRRGDPTADDGDGVRATLVATVEVGGGPTLPALTASSTFCWPLPDGRRENLRDGDGGDSHAFVNLKAELRRTTSVVLCDLPISKRRGAPAKYLHRLRSPLATLENEESGAGHVGTTFTLGLFDARPDDPFEVVPLTKDDVNLTLTTPTGFVLPLLNVGNQSVRIEVTDIRPPLPETLEIVCKVQVTISLGGSTPLTTTVPLTFLPRLMAFRVDQDTGLWLSGEPQTLELFDLKWTFRPNPEPALVTGSVTADKPNGVRIDKALFVLVLKDRNYALGLAPGATVEIDYTRATDADNPVRFLVGEFAVATKGINLRADVTDKPARFNGLETKFKFTGGSLQIHESRVQDFTISGSGPLPPALVGDAVADISLRFAQKGGGSVRLARGSAKIKGSDLLKCRSTRFEVSLDGIGLEFVDDEGADHLYFTLSGRAKYAPLPGDDPSGPLAWMPAIELQLVDCPLTGNMRVIARHVKFTVDLPKKVSFSFLGCFTFEVRSIGFIAQFDKIRDRGEPTSAMQIGGQIMFAEGGGDVLETKVDFHNLYVALPAPGSILPRLYLKQLGIQIKQGDQFELCGDVEFFDNEPVDRNANGTPIYGSGFAGAGCLQIQGMFPMSATFAFLRVSPDGRSQWKRAWFIYLQASQLSIQVPVVTVFLREVGLGFGYRYTLAAIKGVDEASDPGALLKELRKLSRTQGNLSRRDQWRVDLEGPGEGPHWTIALRGMFSQATAQKGPYGDYDARKEEEIPCVYLLDVVAALRNDLTFFMAGRAWLNTNYQDFLRAQVDRDTLVDNPAFSGFIVLSPRQKRFLASLASNPDARFGGHPITPGFLQEAFRNGRFSATLLVEPGLVHYEMGWPNQLQWGGDFGPLQVQFRGGTIFRSSTTEVVVGTSFQAVGSLDLNASIDGNSIGGSISASARVAFGARYIGVLAFRDPLNDSALYGALGVEIRVRLAVAFWIAIKLRLFRKTKTIKKSFSLGVGVNFTAALEVGLLFDGGIGAAGLPALNGRATVGFKAIGHPVHVDIHVEKDGNRLQRAADLTNRFLNFGLEAENVEPIPGTDGASVSGPSGAPPSPGGGGGALSLVGAPAPAPAAVGSDKDEVNAAIDEGAKPPDFYSLVTAEARLPASSADPKRRAYFLLVPGAAADGEPSRFYPVPPSSQVVDPHDSAMVYTLVSDMEWTFPAPDPSVKFEHFDPAPVLAGGTPGSFVPAPGGTPLPWRFDWGKAYPVEDVGDPREDGDAKNVLFLDRFVAAYLTRDDTGESDGDLKLGDPTPPNFGGAESLDDERVRNPSASAFEAAVRGAFEQVAAPYFKFDEESRYDKSLRRACRANTSVYALGGTTDGLPSPERDAVLEKQRAIQARGAILHQMLTDVQRFASLDRDGDEDAAATAEMATLLADSLAFRAGLVFRATRPATSDERPALAEGDPLLWLHGAGSASYVTQRATPDSTAADSPQVDVRPFNRPKDGFHDRTPSFTRIKKYEHANSIAFAWSLTWPPREGDSGTDPEDHLSHYKVRRFLADGDEPQAEFPLRKGSVLYLDRSDGGTPTPTLILSRFQLVDHFDPAPGGVPETLSELGKTYLYTITPVDLAGNESPRPITLAATRYPSDPPAVPTDGELRVSYALPDAEADWPAALDTVPRVRTEGLSVDFSWTDPEPVQGAPMVPVEKYQLVFRREETLPVGFYGADQYTRGGRNDGIPITAARPLRTDILVTFDKPLAPDPDTNRYQVPIDPRELIDAGILPDDRGWRPEAWRIFVQTVSPVRPDNQSAASSLAGVAVRLSFSKAPLPAPATGSVTAPAAPPERDDRRFGVLEWLPDPLRFDLLPPEDEDGVPGFALVPMPALGTPADPSAWIYPIADDVPNDAADLPGLQFELHPERVRAMPITWNQGPSGDSAHPIELHAKYQVFQFDADAKPGEAVESRRVRITPRNVKTGDLFTLTVRNDSVTFRAAANGPNGVVKGLVDKCEASASPSFKRLDAEADPSGLFLTLAARCPTARFTLAAAATGGSVGAAPAIAVTQDLNEWQIDAGLRLVQEVELLPADDLPLRPSDTSNPQGWDVWTPATSRRIALRRQMIEARLWPERTDRSLLGPWYSWRDSYLNWPDPDPQPDAENYVRLIDAAGNEYPGLFDRQRPNFPAMAPLPFDDSPMPAPGGVSNTLTLTVGTQTASLEIGARFTLRELVDAVNASELDAWAEAAALPSADGRVQFALKLTALPPLVEPNTRNTWPYHPLFRALLYNIAIEPDDGGPRSQPLYQIEPAGIPPRGDSASPGDLNDSAPGGGEKVNPFPSGPAVGSADDPTGFVAFLRDNSPEADPHAWGILQRMGLAVAFRVRVRKTGAYVQGSELDKLVRTHLSAALARPAFDALKHLVPHLHVEFLFQPGAKDEVAVDEDPTRRSLRVPGYRDLLALARLSLRPTVTQRMSYRAYTLRSVDTTGRLVAPGGTTFQLKVEAPTANEVTFLLHDGTPSEPIDAPRTLQVVMPPSGVQTVLVRGRDLTGLTVEGSRAIPDPDTPPPATITVILAQYDDVPFRPIDWRSTFLMVPPIRPDSNFVGAPWPLDAAVPATAPVDEGDVRSPMEGWLRLRTYLQSIQAGLPGLAVDRNGLWGVGLLRDAELLPQFLAWLNRFFIEGGDVSAPGDDGVTPNPAASPLAHTGKGPWVTAAYPRTSTPVSLSPDPDGRIRYVQLIEDLWGHSHRYYLRPWGRYDLIWSAVSRSKAVFPRTRGRIDALQRQIASPKPGGLDVVLDRVRPLAAPMVLSSRRLDRPAPPGQVAPPGGIWEVLVERHSEQELIDRNRSLKNHLGFLKVAHSLVRSSRHGPTVEALRPVVARVVSGPFPAAGTPIGAQTFRLVAEGMTPAPFTLNAGDGIAELVDAVNAASGSTIAAAEEFADGPLGGARLVFAAPPPELQLLLVGEGGVERDLLNQKLDLDPSRFEDAVNAVAPTVADDRLPKLPTLPAALTDHLKLDDLTDDDALSIDLPLRSERFTRGLMALQWRALPYYYTHRLLLVAQAAAVSSPVTVIDHRDFAYASPVYNDPEATGHAPTAVMEGVEFPGPGGRRRRIVFSLARLWDCLTPEGRLGWPVEDPEGVGKGDPTSVRRRPSSTPDRDVIYQLLVDRPSGNVEVLAEYRFNEGQTSGYESRKVRGPYRGDAVRLLPPPPGEGVGRRLVALETLLTRVDGTPEPEATASEPVSGRAAFATASPLPFVTFETENIRACGLYLTLSSTSDEAAIARALIDLAATVDASFADALRRLAGGVGPERYAEACIGLEQLVELNPNVRLEVTDGGRTRTLTWPGAMSAAQAAAVEAWSERSLLSAALEALREGIVEEPFPPDAANPVPGDLTVTHPPSRLTILPDRFVWTGAFGEPARADEIDDINTLKAKPGLPAAVVAALDALLAALADPSKIEAVVHLETVEPSWHPRPTQATLPSALAGVLLVGNGLMTVRGMMTRAEGDALLAPPALTEPDRQAVYRAFEGTLNAGLGGSVLRLGARLGSAPPTEADVVASIRPD